MDKYPLMREVGRIRGYFIQKIKRSGLGEPAQGHL